MAEHFPIQNHYDEFTVAFDFDGTLCDSDGGAIEPMCDLVRRLHAVGVNCILFSARTPCHEAALKRWCDENNVPMTQIVAGSKPPADVFIDDRAPFPPVAVLDELIFRRRGGNATHRVSKAAHQSELLREMRDVPENPDWSGASEDFDFRVVIPWSAGLDSTTVVGMAVHAGHFMTGAARTVYVDTGAPYTGTELLTLELLAWRMGIPAPTVIDLEVDYDHYRHIDVGRNYVILDRLREEFGSNWGEIWFGNQAGFGESSPRGGDKSSWTFNLIQGLWTSMGSNVRIVNPLAGMDKPDLVRWWARRDFGVPPITFSCFAAGPQRCGTCSSCFRWWSALVAGGHAEAANKAFPSYDFTDIVAANRKKYHDGPVSMFSPGRWEWVEDVLTTNAVKK